MGLSLFVTALLSWSALGSQSPCSVDDLGPLLAQNHDLLTEACRSCLPGNYAQCFPADVKCNAQDLKLIRLGHTGISSFTSYSTECQLCVMANWDTDKAMCGFSSFSLPACEIHTGECSPDGAAPHQCFAVGWGPARHRPSPSETRNCLFMSKPSPFVRLVARLAVGLPRGGMCGGGAGGCALDKILPYDAQLRTFGNDWPPFGYTMCGSHRLEGFRAAIEDVERNGIPGAIVELGVWRGGAMLLAAAVTSETPQPRALHLFDAFDTISSYGDSADFLAATEAEVREAFDTFGLARDNIFFHKGLFRDTLPQWNKDKQIAVLRVDANHYDSYQDAFYNMYESVSVGGIVILDDVVSHHAVTRFWNDFSRDQGLLGNVTLNIFDGHSAWFRKERVSAVDWSYFRPPQDVNLPV